MRYVIALLALSLVGCLHTAESNDSQTKCAQANLYYAGFDVTGTRDGRDVGNIKCDRPETPKQKCEVQATQANTAAAAQFDADWRIKRWAVGAGYVFYIIPGAGLYYMWKDENQVAIDKHREEAAARLAACEKIDATAH